MAKISKLGIDLIKRYEGYSAKPYLCPAGVPTIGYGSTVYEDGKKVTLRDAPITAEKAEALLRHKVDTYYLKEVERLLDVDLNQNQIDALASFAYNVGVGNFERSMLRRKLNGGDYAGAADEFLKWTKAGGKTLKGLQRRRMAERALFISDEL